MIDRERSKAWPFLVPAAAFVPILLSAPAMANWPGDPTVNVPLCTAAGYQSEPAAVTDGAGGMIAVWTDIRSGTHADFYARRIDRFGRPLWAADGVPICTSGEGKLNPRIVSDGSNGAIIVWEDARNSFSDLYAQRVNASGVPQWTANGSPVCTAPENQQHVSAVSDGSGGAIVAWVEYRNGGVDTDLFAQRINGSGATLWATNGVALCTAGGDQTFPRIVTDGQGGAIVTWADHRPGGLSGIYARRVNAGGTPQWTANGVAICTVAANKTVPSAVADGTGGAIFSWTEDRAGNGDIYAQRIDASGAVQWTAGGAPVCTHPSLADVSVLTSDGGGGAIIAWHDYRSGGADIYAQRVSAAAGAALWTGNGVQVTADSGYEVFPAIVASSDGEAILVWHDARNGTTDLYAQRLGAGGPLWTPGGMPLSTASGGQGSPAVIANGTLGAIVAWEDTRADENATDIYAQRITRNGDLGPNPVPAMPREGPLVLASLLATLGWIALRRRAVRP
jgi:hypothetical protein